MINAIRDNWWKIVKNPPPPPPPPPDQPSFAWRGIDKFCIQDNGENTGESIYDNLEKYNVNTLASTGEVKDNAIGDPDYIAPIQDEACPVPVYEWEGYQPTCIIDETGVPCDNAIDVAFVLDVTGSMGQTIENLKISLSAIVDDIVANFPNGYRLGLITVTDGASKYIIKNSFALSNENFVQNSLNNIQAAGGGDEPEPTDLGIQAALDGELGIFRDNVTKVIFLITDARPSGSDDNYGPEDMTFSKSLADRAASEGIQIVPIAVGVATEPYFYYSDGTPYENAAYDTIQEIHNYYATITGTTAYNVPDGNIGTSVQNAITETDCVSTDTVIGNTGQKEFDRLRERNITTGNLTGVTKVNVDTDPDYIAPVYDPDYCKEGELYITAYPTTINITSEGRSILTRVASNTTWTVTTPLAVTTNMSEGTHHEDLIITVPDNVINATRTFTTTLTSTDGSVTLNINIIQQPPPQPAPTNTKISLSRSFKNFDPCNGSSGIYYINNTNFENATEIYTNSSGTTLAFTGYYSNGFYFRYWNGSAFTQGGFCGAGGQL